MTDPVAVAGHSGAKVELDRAELTARLFHEHGDRLVGLAAAKRFVPLAARAGPEEIVELRDEQRRVVEAVRQLPTRQRECLVLRYYDDLNTGIGDGENLAWKLAMVVNGTAGPVLLDTYEAERRPVAARALESTGAASSLILGNHVLARLLRDRIVLPLMNKASMQRRVWENLSQLKVTYRNGPLGRRARRWFSGPGPLPGDRVPDIDCARTEGGGPTTLHAELGNKWALVVPGRMVSDEYAALVAKRLGDDSTITLVADHGADEEIMLVRPDAHLGWRGHGDPGALDRWLAALTRRGRADWASS